MASFLEKPWRVLVASVGRVLYDDVGTAACRSRQEGGRASGDFVCPVELAFVPCRDVVDTEYVFAVSHDGWPVLIRVEEAGDGVG